MSTRKIPRPRARFVTCILSVALLSAMLPLASSPAQAVSGVDKDMTFFLHFVNSTEVAKSIPGGGSTITYFDTTLDFSETNVSILVEGTQKVLKWYLCPPLAGEFRADGFTLRIWANSSTSASSSGQVTLQVLEVAEGGSSLVHEINLGSQSFTLTHELKTWSSSFGDVHPFAAGSSIEVRMTVNPGALQGVWFHYDTPQFNSRVSFHGPDSIDVAGIATLDWERNQTASFDPDTTNQTIFLQARVTDPLGGYDIRWVNLTLVSPGGDVIIDNASMNKVSGTPVSYESLFELEWNYSGQPMGRYTVIVWALDNNGHNHYYFFEQYDYAAYPAVAEAEFFIGGLPYYVHFLVQDTLGIPLEQARVSLYSAGNQMDTGTTDDDGIVNLTAFGGVYDLEVVWTQVLVAQESVSIEANITAEEPVIINASVYYPAVRTLDAQDVPLSSAAIYMTYPNGTTARTPVFTDDEGVAALGRIAGGEMEILVLWRGVEVANGSLTIDANAPPAIDISTAVYYLTVSVTDSRSVPVVDAQVILSDVVYGLVADARITDDAGVVISRLPVGHYAALVIWNDVVVSSDTIVSVESNDEVEIIAEIYYLTVSVLDSRSQPVPDAELRAVSSSGRIFASATSDSDGEVVLRVPQTIVTLEASWLGISVGTVEFSATEDADILFTVEVYTIDIIVKDAKGRAVKGASLAIESDGRLFSLEVSNASGEASVRLPAGSYLLSVRYTAVYLYTYIDAEANESVELWQDQVVTLRLEEYPPSLFGTLAFKLALLVAVLVVAVGIIAYKLGQKRTSSSRPQPPSAEEREESDEQR